nr:MAG TPA: hypothetical protein [Caudoviricetes sp.]DAO94091.1 MAG TPA: hypothetical protein [Caudoviricetes sp.]DAV35192.1 MAG TPA: hypothetical protein [Caudoviricetes sp.]DAW80706.1 MAG TPA: hypothetical protein [Caudoviricetes sp.]
MSFIDSPLLGKIKKNIPNFLAHTGQGRNCCDSY